MAHLQSPKTGPAAPPHDIPSPRSVGVASGNGHRSGGSSGGGGGSHGRHAGGGNHNHSHSHGGGHNHSHGHHGHSHSHGGKNTGDPALIGAKRFIPLSFVVLSTLLVLYGCWPSAHQWHEPIDHGAAFSSWVYASHAAYRESASVSSVLPRGPAILDLPLFGGATASRDLTALPAFDATDRSAVSNVSATSLTRLRPAVQQLGTRVQRNSQVLLYGAGAGSVHGRDYVASYLSAARTNYSVALWFTHSGSVNALWRQYAQLSQRIGLRTISLKPNALVPNVLSWVYRFVPSTLIVLDRFDEPSIFLSPTDAAATTSGSGGAATNGSRPALGALTSTALDSMWLPRRGHSIALATRHVKGFKSKLQLNAFARTGAVRYVRTPLGDAAPATEYDLHPVQQLDDEAVEAFPHESTLSAWCTDRMACLGVARVLLQRANTGYTAAPDKLVAAVRKHLQSLDAALPPATPPTNGAGQNRLVAATTSALLTLLLKSVQSASGAAAAGSAWQVLRLLSVYDSGDAIPRSIIELVAKAPITQTLTELEELGLVQFTPTDVFITATVQAAIRAQLSSAEVVSVAVQNLEAIGRVFVYSPTREDTWIGASTYVSHILALSSHAPSEGVTLVSAMKAVSSVCTAAAAFLHDVLGESALSLALYTRSAAYVVNVDDGNSEAHARALSGTGVVHTALGNHQKAIDSLVAARDVAIEVFGEQSDRVASELINLSNAHKAKGENNKARELLELAIGIHKKLYGEWHEVADDYALLSSVASARGDHNEALKLLTRALEINTRAPSAVGGAAVSLSGGSAPSTAEAEQLLIASRYAAIGDVWFALNRHVDAINFFSRSVEVYKAVYDSLHPALAHAYERLGTLFHGLGRWQQARVNFKKALDIYQQSGGDVHPDLLELIGRLGGAINAMGNSDVALSYYNHCWNICLSLYGDTHTLTAEWKQKTMDLYQVVQKKNAEYEARRKREAEDKERAARKAQQNDNAKGGEL